EGRLRGLESHIRYRIALRTFNAADSRAVLGAPDAYALPPEPGAGYLKVDAAPPERFTTAWMPDGSYVDAVVTRLAGRERAHQVSRPRRPAAVSLDAVLARVDRDAERGPGVVAFGLVDDPGRQTQPVLTHDFTGAGGHLAVVGGPRTG